MFGFWLQFKIQFDDSLTRTFEYASETSLLVDDGTEEEDEVDGNFYKNGGNGAQSKLLTSVPLGEFDVRFLSSLDCKITKSSLNKIFYYFRRSSVCQLYISKNKWCWIWIGSYKTIISIIRRIHTANKQHIWWSRIFETSHRWWNCCVEQWRYSSYRFALLIGSRSNQQQLFNRSYQSLCAFSKSMKCFHVFKALLTTKQNII